MVLAFHSFFPLFKPVRVIARFQNVAMVSHPIKQCRCHLGITEDLYPFAKAEVGGNNQRRFLIKLTDQMEQ
jgi:hypothetical protein